MARQFIVVGKMLKERTGFAGDIQDVSLAVSKDFDLGKFLSSKIIPVGYEDLNFAIETSKGKFFVKIFFKERSLGECKRIVDVMAKAIDNGVNIPKLYKSKQGFFHVLTVENMKLRLCVMDFIEGGDVFTSNRHIGDADIRSIARQAALINSIKLKPKPIYDSWAVVNFLKEFEEKGKYLGKEDMKLVKPLLGDFENLKIKNLPHCFVHGDIIKTNIMKDSRGVWIIDFSVANYYPRIQEMAVLACDLLFDKNSKKTEYNLNLALEEYQKTVKLMPRELDVLPAYIKLAHAMHVLRANYEKKVNRNKTAENEYFLEIGRRGLKSSL